MKKRLPSIINKTAPILAILILLAIWEAVSRFEIVPSFMLPTPSAVLMAFIHEFPTLMSHSVITLSEAFLGLMIGIGLGFFTAFLMDRFLVVKNILYPILVLTQTIPSVAIAPLLVLWMGYDMAPKVTLVVLVCFFPLAVGLYNGFQHADEDTINLLRAMGARKMQIFRYVKLPSALPQFFAGLRIAVSYSVVGAVIAEWLGGFNGLGVYMTRVKNSYSFDKMFAVIFLVSAISLALMGIVTLLERALIKGKPSSKSRKDAI